jgi:hypothetical protein
VPTASCCGPSSTRSSPRTSRSGPAIGGGSRRGGRPQSRSDTRRLPAAPGRRPAPGPGPGTTARDSSGHGSAPRLQGRPRRGTAGTDGPHEGGGRSTDPRREEHEHDRTWAAPAPVTAITQVPGRRPPCFPGTGAPPRRHGAPTGDPRPAVASVHPQNRRARRRLLAPAGPRSARCARPGPAGAGCGTSRAEPLPPGAAGRHERPARVRRRARRRRGPAAAVMADDIGMLRHDNGAGP